MGLAISGEGHSAIIGGICVTLLFDGNADGRGLSQKSNDSAGRVKNTMSTHTAKQLIASSSYDAVPGHPKLVDDGLLVAIRKHGAHHIQPHPRATALEAVLAEH
jgi:hypothetical protein